MPLPKLAIKPEFRDLLPPLSAEERMALEESILSEGCRDPIVIWGSIIVDGHNRYDICAARGLPYTTVDFYGGPDFDYLPSMAVKEEAVKRWIIETQLARRNLTDEQRALYTGILYNSAKKAVGNPDVANIQNRLNEVKNQLGQNDPIVNSLKNAVSVPDSTAAKIAREHGVSEATVKRAGKFAEGIDRIGKISPEVREKILSGASKSVVSMGQVRALAGASEERVKAAVRAVAENKPLEREPVTRSAGAAGHTMNPDATLGEVDLPISPGVTCASSAGQFNSPAAAKQGGKPSPDTNAPSPAAAEPLGGGQFMDEAAAIAFIADGLKNECQLDWIPDNLAGIIAGVDAFIDNIPLARVGELMKYHGKIARFTKNALPEHIRRVEAVLVKHNVIREEFSLIDTEGIITDEPPAVERPDAINFYADDFLSGVVAMSNEQRGAYITLLMMEQSKGPLTKEEMLAVTSDKLVHKKFQLTDDGTYVNPRMEKEVKTRLAHQSAQRDRANKRWNGAGASATLSDRAAECRGNAAALPVLKELKDKTKQDKQKDVYPATHSQDNKGVNVLSFDVDVNKKAVGDTDGAGAGARGDFDQSAGAGDDFDQSVNQDGGMTAAGFPGSDIPGVENFEYAALMAPPKATKEPRTQRGPDGWVKLTDTEYAKLVDELGEKAVKDYIKRVDQYCASNGNAKKYKSFYHVITMWAERDNKKNGAHPQSKPLTAGRTVYDFERKSIESGKYDNLLP